ncbi:MAG: YceI family protein [Bacteroidales bacterium]|nr:YceI family protein [Bacteroidales bacterium]
MKRTLILFLFAVCTLSLSAQKYITNNGYIGFFSHTAMEDIKGDNNQVAGILDTDTGEMVFQVLIKSFHFDRDLLKEHFNENYMDSEKYPKSSFKGKIANLSTVDFKKAGTYEVDVEGDLTIRDVTKKVTVKGTLDVIAGGLNANTKFKIVPEDFNISIPGVVRDKIAKDLEVTVVMKYLPM